MYGQQFYNETTRRYVAVFGTHFNDIVITRKDNTGTEVMRMKVPIHYAPMQKILARLEQDPDLNAPAMALPRMSFEITGMNYSPTRKIASTLKYVKGTTLNDSLATQYSPVPYDIEFQLNIMTKYNEDGSKILEQILPFFKPDVTPSVKLIDDLDIYLDIPIVLNSVTQEDVYEGNFEERRALIWTLSFTLKGWFFGPQSEQKVIKFAEAGVYSPLTGTDPVETVTVKPGLTANGEPTTVANNSVSYDQINIDDDWAFIVEVSDG